MFCTQCIDKIGLYAFFIDRARHSTATTEFIIRSFYGIFVDIFDEIVVNAIANLLIFITIEIIRQIVGKRYIIILEMRIVRIEDKRLDIVRQLARCMRYRLFDLCIGPIVFVDRLHPLTALVIGRIAQIIYGIFAITLGNALTIKLHFRRIDWQQFQ